MVECDVSAREYLQFPIFVSSVFRCRLVRAAHLNDFLRLILNRWCRHLCTRSIELHRYIASRQDMTLAPTCAAHCRALCDIGCARVTVARDDDGIDECDDLDGPDFSRCEYGRLVLAWLLLSLCIWLSYWCFCIVRQNDKFIFEAWLVCFPFVGIYFWEKPLTT
jgi:hypothetical protein